jgi:hypothetical protein
MVGLVPTIPVFVDACDVQDVDARHKGEHDGDWNKVVVMGSGLGPDGPPRNDGMMSSKTGSTPPSAA